MTSKNQNYAHKNEVNTGQKHPSQSWSTLFYFHKIWLANKPRNLSSFHTCEVDKVASKLYEPIKRGEREICDDMSDVQMRERSLPFIHFIEGDETHLLGFMSLHLTEADRDNLCMRENKFKIIFLLSE